jgi:hypothetical protein
METWYKFTDETLSCWSAIMRVIPGSRLILRCAQLSEPSTVARLPVPAAIPGPRIAPGFLGGYQEVDIALDPFPYSGGLTTCEALYMGVPVITRAGEIFAAGHSVSHLAHVGLDQWIGADIRDTSIEPPDSPPICRLLPPCARGCGTACWQARFATRRALAAAWEPACAVPGKITAPAANNATSEPDRLLRNLIAVRRRKIP